MPTGKANYIDGKDVLVFIKRVNRQVPDTTFRAVACLESNDFSGNREKKTVNNKCTAGWEDGIAGNGNWQVSAAGQAITNPEALAEMNYQELAEIWVAGEVFEIKMANQDGTYYRGGSALITDFSETANTDDPMGFDATFSGLGVPVMTEPVEG